MNTTVQFWAAVITIPTFSILITILIWKLNSHVRNSVDTLWAEMNAHFEKVDGRFDKVDSRLSRVQADISMQEKSDEPNAISK
jgi:hypothetical protein